MENVKKTILYDAHIKQNAKMIEFAGWMMPVEYEGLTIEHDAVRNNAGLFDVSHMGEVEVTGPDALNYVQRLITNDAEKLEDNQVLYSLMCYSDGGIVDDLLVYRFNKEKFLLVINAANIEKDYDWMLLNKGDFDVCINNISSEISEVALQGPKAQEILQRLTNYNLDEIKFFYFAEDIEICKVKCIVSRTGYTGEDGFEIYTSNENIEKIYNCILDEGKAFGLKAAGLGCRDTLRFEACLPLYGNEISRDITPLEAGLGYFVKLDKKDFIGKEALVKQKSEGLKRKLVGFEMIDKGIPRHGYDVLIDDRKIGFVTTGYLSPTLKKCIGLAMVDIDYSNIGCEFNVAIRNKTSRAKVISKKFYEKKYKK
ncbi:aminomethyltransferase [Caloramator quimbayensis]|uniref:Aminomethyltransferase n=1 Tax=Caloramator quimbayensis TaxID=1147123 RepID=A0A1T4XGA2_9CLOT|nr:glycine cleavage system aminomethyltransferase GcvT [Caloramator quimbayensis]SKA88111.1 aminomethyltransferase [Caloramator quimbayensis]